MRQIITLAAAMLLAMGLSASPAMAGNAMNPCAMKHKMNPCNPCAMKHKMNPCNPCAMKHKMIPCNPCAMKHKMNPCNPCSMKPMGNPCNPCSMKGAAKGQWGTPGNTPVRKHAFDNYQQAVAYGKKLWNDENLGTSGVACLSCHSDYQYLHLDRNRNFPHFVKMVGDVVSLDQMINYCMLNPMKGKQFEKNSKELTAMGAYYRAYRMQYRKEHRH